MQLKPARARRFSGSQATLAALTLSRMPFTVPFLEYSLLAVGSKRPLSPKHPVELLLDDWHNLWRNLLSASALEPAADHSALLLVTAGYVNTHRPNDIHRRIEREIADESA